MDSQPRVAVTGASGLLGRHLIQALADHCYVHAIARRSPREAGVELRPNIRWVPADIGDEGSVRSAVEAIGRWGGADYVVHLAGYYDYTGERHPEYERTNVDGTRHVVTHFATLRPRHFIHASSLTVHEFRRPHERLTEDSPLDATSHYAVSKARAEDVVRRHAGEMRCSIVRMAAIFTDWCEHGPLHQFLSTWLTPGWRSRVLAGHGRSAVPYLHVDDLVRLVLRMIDTGDALPRLGVYLASPDGATTHEELYTIANRFSFGEVRAPIRLPRLLCLLGILAHDGWGRLRGDRPFERAWMVRYVDRALAVDASKTRRVLAWAPTPRLAIGRRLLFLVENMKTQPHEWKRLNDEASHRTVQERLNFRVYERLLEARPAILAEVASELGAAKVEGGAEGLSQDLQDLFRGLETAIRIGDHRNLLATARLLATRGGEDAGRPQGAARAAVRTLARVAERTLVRRPDLAALRQRVHDLVTLNFQLVEDEIEATVDRAAKDTAARLSAGDRTATNRPAL